MRDQLCDDYCEKCYYLETNAHCCSYILLEGHSRGCPPGTGCRKRNTRKRAIQSIGAVSVKQAKKIQKKKCSDKQRRRMELYQQGYSDVKIGKLLGEPTTTVYSWRASMKLPANPRKKKEVENQCRP